VLELADIDTAAGQHDQSGGTGSAEGHGEARHRELVQGGRSRGHDQHPVIQLVAELVVGHVLHVLDGQSPVLAGPDVRDCHGIHRALLLSCSPPWQEALTFKPLVESGTGQERQALAYLAAAKRDRHRIS
jgi:hypothetical protein